MILFISVAIKITRVADWLEGSLSDPEARVCSNLTTVVFSFLDAIGLGVEIFGKCQETIPRIRLNLVSGIG